MVISMNLKDDNVSLEELNILDAFLGDLVIEMLGQIDMEE